MRDVKFVIGLMKYASDLIYPGQSVAFCMSMTCIEIVSFLSMKLIIQGTRRGSRPWPPVLENL